MRWRVPSQTALSNGFDLDTDKKLQELTDQIYTDEGICREKVLDSHFGFDIATRLNDLASHAAHWKMCKCAKSMLDSQPSDKRLKYQECKKCCGFVKMSDFSQ